MAKQPKLEATLVTTISGQNFTSPPVHELKPESILYLLQYGWNQSLNDAHAGPGAKQRKEELLGSGDPDSPTVVALRHTCVEKRIASILAGELSAGHGGGRDPLRSVAVLVLQARAAAKGKTLPKGESLKALVDSLLASEKGRADVMAEIAKRREMAELDVTDIIEG